MEFWHVVIYLGLGALLLALVLRRDEIGKNGTDKSSRVLAMISMVLVWPVFIGVAIYHALKKRD
jgi:hypothetical protein